MEESMDPFNGRTDHERYRVLTCSECGAAASADTDACEECGFRNKAALQPGFVSKDLYEDVHEGVPAAKEGVGWAKWWVYMFIDPRNDVPVYVGLTMYLGTRKAAHFSSDQSAVFQWIREHGLRPKMITIGYFPTRIAARQAEEALIAFIPGLVNRDCKATRRRMKARWCDTIVTKAA
jgi:hypothetical protein